MSEIQPRPGCRISRVRPKGKGLAEIVLLEPSVDRDWRLVLGYVRKTMTEHVDSMGIAGFAFVVWNRAKDATAIYKSWEHGVATNETPDFVRRALRTYFLDRRARHVMADEMGWADPPDEPA